MAHFYFFKNDGQCKWVNKEMQEQIPKHLVGELEYEGKKRKFYLILKWVKSDTRGVNLESLDSLNINYVESVDDLPEGAGIFITGYGANVEELKAAKKRGIPVIERPCPWIKELSELLEAHPESHQCILVIDKDHMVYECYNSIFPKDTIIVNPENYIEEIKKYKNEKPVHLLAYATFRKKDADAIADHIKNNYNHPENMLGNYQKTLCCWTKQGLLEEITSEVKNQHLEEVWVICSSAGDRSTMSILKQIDESCTKAVIIRNAKDIPETVSEDSRIGVLVAPIPLSTETSGLKKLIWERLGSNV